MLPAVVTLMLTLTKGTNGEAYCSDALFCTILLLRPVYHNSYCYIACKRTQEDFDVSQAMASLSLCPVDSVAVSGCWRQIFSYEEVSYTWLQAPCSKLC